MVRDSQKPNLRVLLLDVLNTFVEHGALVIFVAAIIGLDALRRKFGVESWAYRAIYVAEVVTLVTMVVPKAIRALGAILETLAVVGHRVVYSFRHGSRRPEQVTENGNRGKSR
jgi:hypothetical protein